MTRTDPPKPAIPSLSEKDVENVISLNPQAITRKALADFFGVPNGQIKALDEILDKLKSTQRINVTTKGSITAQNPLSDVGFVRVKEIDQKGRAVLQYRGVEEGFPFTVMASAKIARQWKARPGEEFLASFKRYNKAELRATFISRRRMSRDSTLEVKFTKAADPGNDTPKCIALDKNIKTVFNAVVHNASRKADLKASWIARIPKDFDPRNPHLLLQRQQNESSSGNFIPYILAQKHGIPVRHKRETMVEARKLATMDIDYSHRRDLRHEPILIIDPPNPFDRDDGVMVDYDFERGLYRSLTVISDVAERVRPGTLAAHEAFERGNSHFFTHDRKVFPMLPTALVNACSLVQGKTRPVIYCETFWDMNGNEIDHNIGLGVIASQKTLAYGEMEDKIQGQGQSSTDIYRHFLRTLLARRQSDEAGQLDKQDKGNMDDLYTPSSQFLVHYLMTHSGAKFAEFARQNDLPVMYRVHTAARNELIYERARLRIANMGYELPDSPADLTIDHLHELGAYAKDKNLTPYVNEQLRQLMDRAQYSAKPEWHFGLRLNLYAHSTSPIRRVSDLIMQKALHRVLKPAEVRHETALSHDEEARLDEIIETANINEVKAERLSKDYNRFNHIQDLQRFEGHVIRTRIHSIREDGIDLVHPDNGLITSLFKDDMPDNWDYDPNARNLTVYHPEHGYPEQRLTVGDVVRGRIDNVNPQQGLWDFQALEAVKAQNDNTHGNIPSGF